MGINASLQLMDSDQQREVRRSGCGQFEHPLTCASQPSAQGPFSQSSGYYEWRTSNEPLDLQRQLLLRNSCGGVNSRICAPVPGFEAAQQHAVKTPLDSERTSKVSRTTKMESQATTIHNEFWFIPMFQVVTVYGLSKRLEREPRHAPRARINTMRFTQ